MGKSDQAAERRSNQGQKLTCHSDYVDPETARKLQDQKLVQLGVGVKTSDRLI
jgi:hypothetical protein